MGLSEAEIETRLASLRRQREALDREIADLVLYRELGRRLGGVRAGVDPETGSRTGPLSGPAPDPPFERDIAPTGSPAPGHSGARATPDTIPPAVAFTEDAAGARRYGRALIEAACAALGRAGRPLHAAEILDVLSAQGFTVPGRDPVAALNTRLWKRSGPGGPLRRVGEAIYALAADELPA